jgi:hypothetical protein
MKDRFSHIIRLALSLVILIVVVAGCAESSQSSKYPANLSGRVTIVEKMRCATAVAVAPMKQGNIFWIVQVSVKNASYSQPIVYNRDIACPTGWLIVANNVSYYPCDTGCLSDKFNIATGQSGQLALVFSVPSSIAVEDAQICYQGQDSSSFGKLSKEGTLLAYDWSSRSAINVTPTPNLEIYLVRPVMAWSDADRYMQLKTVARWEGTSSQKMKFTATQVPCVLNYGWKETSAIRSHVTVNAWDKNNMSSIALSYRGTYSLTIEDAGVYTIDVDSVGAQWWVKIGVEP